MTAIPAVRRFAPATATLVIGIALGWAFGGSSVRALHASRATDRWNDCILTTGIVQQESSTALKGVVPQEAVYYLNYRTGFLLVGLPSPRITPKGTEYLGDFAERDLVADFGLKPGETPHFLMTTAQVGSRSEGWDPLFIFETNSGQVATYRVKVQATAGSNKPVVERIDRKVDPLLGRGSAR
jgi:hypothetical protein